MFDVSKSDNPYYYTYKILFFKYTQSKRLINDLLIFVN